MADEPNGTSNGAGGGENKPAPPGIPPAAAAPPPLAEAPPPLTGAPPPQAPPPGAPEPVKPGKRGLSPELIVAIMFGLILALAGILWATGVFNRSDDRPDGPLPTVAPVPVPMPPPSASDSYPSADEMASPPCDNVRNERDVAGTPPRADEQRNTLAVTASGTYLWNGAEVDAIRLRQYLDIVGTMSPAPVTIVRVDPGAPPSAVGAASETIERALHCRFQPS